MDWNQALSWRGQYPRRMAQAVLLVGAFGLGLTGCGHTDAPKLSAADFARTRPSKQAAAPNLAAPEAPAAVSADMGSAGDDKNPENPNGAPASGATAAGSAPGGAGGSAPAAAAGTAGASVPARPSGNS